MKLKEILFDLPIKDQKWYMNSRLYLGISGKIGHERSIIFQNQNKDPLQMRYFENKETREKLYRRAIKLMKKYHKEDRALPSGVLDELFV